MSGIWAVVPVKEFEGAKQRLSSALSPEERRVLATTMLEDVLDAVSAVRELAGVLVVTVDPAAISLAAHYGARVVTEGAREGHTGAVAAAAWYGDTGAVLLALGVLVGTVVVVRRLRRAAERVEASAREAQNQQLRLAFLAEASNVLAASLDYETTFRTVVHLAVPFLADLCAVDVLEADDSVRRLSAFPG